MALTLLARDIILAVTMEVKSDFKFIALISTFHVYLFGIIRGMFYLFGIIRGNIL